MIFTILTLIGFAIVIYGLVSELDRRKKQLDAYDKIKQTVRHHLNTSSDKKAYEFIRDAVFAKIEHTSQEPPEDKICPYCKGAGDILNSNGDYKLCNYCNGLGIIDN